MQHTTRPAFSLKSDSSEPGITSCTANFTFGNGLNLSFPCATGKIAFAMQDLVDAAYELGVQYGRQEVITELSATIKKFG